VRELTGMNTSPIALFVYNRPEHTRKTVEALQRNNLAKESELFIFSDSPKDDKSKEKVEKVRDYLKTVTGFKKVTVIERSENLGLAKSIISGVTQIVNKYGEIIVLEDDLVTSPYFLEYMNGALDLYEKENRVISIHGYTLPVKKPLPETFFIKGADCWGWATWKRGWDLFEPDGKKLLAKLEKRNLIKEFDFDGTYNYSGMLKRQIAGLTNSWAIRWYASAFLAHKLTLYPGESLVQNIGQDASGTHMGKGGLYNTLLSNKKTNIGEVEITENKEARRVFIQYFKSLKPNIFERIIKKMFK
jgi:hypothetical protein